MTIRAGIGGWTFAPWRGPFFPKGLPHAAELAHASRQVSAIEINGTFYRTQTQASFAKWAADTPDDFVFAVKGHRSVTNRKVLAEAGESVQHFIGSGLAELGPKLGPINWQLTPTKRFDPDDLDAFLGLLPDAVGGCRLRHALEVRHPSFLDPEAAALARRHGVALVFADHETYPALDVPGPDFVYARLQRCREAEPDGYAPHELDAWAGRARDWEVGDGETRDVFVFFIAGDKVRAPAAATALLSRL